MMTQLRTVHQQSPEYTVGIRFDGQKERIDSTFKGENRLEDSLRRAGYLNSLYGSGTNVKVTVYRSDNSVRWSSSTHYSKSVGY